MVTSHCCLDVADVDGLPSHEAALPWTVPAVVSGFGGAFDLERVVRDGWKREVMG